MKKIIFVPRPLATLSWPVRGALLFLLLFLTAWLYWPGLNGDFLLDDYQNLKSLEDISPHASLHELFAYALNGVAGDLGRAIPLLSFALQAEAWPNSPFAFKLVNVVLHLLNGVLLFWLWCKVERLKPLSGAPAYAVALFATAAWLLHPLLISTTLYVVQRMVEWSALFTLAGLISYVHGRQHVAAGREARGIVFIVSGLGFGGLLATLSKEIGLLIFLYAAVFEITLLNSLAKGRLWRIGQWGVLFAPLAIVAVYTAYNFQASIMPSYALRDFDLWERLLTQGRALTDYLALILYPRPQSLGLFHDDYLVSRGLLTPWQTLASLIVIISLLCSAIFFRQRLPFLSFGLLWFFSGHLIESTVLPLELYFEHRNYLPSAGLLLGLVACTVPLYHKINSLLLRKALTLTMAIWLISIALITSLEANLWGQPVKQAITWANTHPNSIRAKERLANIYALHRQYQSAAKQFEQLADDGHAGAYLSWLLTSCYDPAIRPPSAERMLVALHQSRFSNAPVAAMEQLVMAIERGECRNLPYNTLDQIILALIDNPRYRIRHSALWVLHARLAAAFGDFVLGAKHLDSAFRLTPNTEVALLQARYFATIGQFGEALQSLDHAKQALSRMSFRSRPTWSRRIEEWEILVRREMENSR